MANKEVIIEIKGKIGNIEGKLKKLEASTKRTAKASSRMFSLSVFQMAARGISQVMGKMNEFINLYEKQRTAERKLFALMKNRNDYQRKQYIQNLALSRQMQRQTSYGDEQILQSIAQFQTFGNISQRTAREATQYAADIAATTGQSITSVSIQLGKALSAPLKLASSLRRSGIMFDEDRLRSLGTTAERQAYLLQEIQSQYGGAAAGARNEFQSFRNVLGDIKESIGKNLLPMFKALAPVIKGVFSALNWVVGGLRNLFDASTNVQRSTQELEVAFAEYNTEIKKLSSQEKLIERYEQLANKTNRSVQEQNEYNKLLKQLSRQIPTAIEGIDGMGNAMGISASRAREFIQAQREIAGAKLRNQFNTAMNETQQAVANFAMTRNLQGDTRLTNRLMRMSGDNPEIRGLLMRGVSESDTAEDRGRAIQEMQKLNKSYDKYYEILMKSNSATDSQIQSMAILAVSTGRLSGNFQSMADAVAAFRQQLEWTREASAAINQMGLQGLSQISATGMRTLREYYNRVGYAEGVDDAAIRQAMQARLNRIVSSERTAQRRTNSGGNNLNKEIEKIRNFLNNVNDVYMLEIDVKLKRSAQNFFKKFNINRQGQAQITAIMDAGNMEQAYKKFAEIVRRRFGNAFSNRQLRDAFNAQAHQRQMMLQEFNEQQRQAVDNYINANNTIYNTFKKINDERIAAEKAILQDRSYANEEERQAQLNLVNRIAKLRKAAAISEMAGNIFQGAGGLYDTVTQTGGTATDRAGRAFGAMGQVGGLAKNIPVVGETISKIMGGVQAAGQFFTKVFGGETEQEKMEKMKKTVSLINAQIENQIFFQQKINRRINDRLELLQFELKTLYKINDENEKYTAQTEAYNDVINEFEAKYGKMSKEQLTARMKELQIQREQLAGEKASVDLREAELIYLDWYQSEAQGFISMVRATNRQREASISGEMDLLNKYIDAQASLYNLDLERNEALEKQLGLQRKLSDELIKQLRALGNIQINNMLDKLNELAFKIKTGEVREGSQAAIIGRQNIMTAIGNILGGLGQTQLQKALIGERASYLEEADQKKFLQKAGFGNVVTFASGGYTGDSNAMRLVGKRETVLNEQLTNLLSTRLGVSPYSLPAALASGGGNPINIVLNNSFSGDISRNQSRELENVIVDTVQRSFRRMGIRM